MNAQATKICPLCAEEILAAAQRCKHCQADLSQSPKPVTIERTSKSIKIAQALGWLALIVGAWNFFANASSHFMASELGLVLVILSIFWLIGVRVLRWWRNG